VVNARVDGGDEDCVNAPQRVVREAGGGPMDRSAMGLLSWIMGQVYAQRKPRDYRKRFGKIVIGSCAIHKEDWVVLKGV